MDQLRHLPFDNIGYAQIDTHRAIRKGLPEVVFCQSKTTQQALGIFDRLISHHDRVMGTRVPPDMAEAIISKIPESHYDPLSRILTIARQPLLVPPDDSPYGVIVTGGTADLPVAEEAAQTMEFYGGRVKNAILTSGLLTLHGCWINISR
jgi:NCAIR mutase (PurE)-related protein